MLGISTCFGEKIIGAKLFFIELFKILYKDFYI